MIGNRFRRSIVEVNEGSGEVRRKLIRPIRITRRVNVGFHEEPIELEFRELYVPPNELGHEGRCESCALPLIGIRQSARSSIDSALRKTPKIDGLAVGKSEFLDGAKEGALEIGRCSGDVCGSGVNPVLNTGKLHCCFGPGVNETNSGGPLNAFGGPEIQAAITLIKHVFDAG